MLFHTLGGREAARQPEEASTMHRTLILAAALLAMAAATADAQRARTPDHIHPDDVSWAETGWTMDVGGTIELDGQVTIGDGGDTVAINSSDWDIDATGIATGLGNITSDGTVDANAFTSDASAGLDTQAAGALLLGAATATSVEIGDAGVTTDLQGPVTVLEGTGNGIDTAGAGVLALGEATATSVEIADTAVATDIQGTLSVDEAATFDAAVQVDAASLHTLDATGTGATAMRFGATVNEGWEVRVYEETISPAAIETNTLNTPAGAVLLSVQTNVEVLLVAGGTSVTLSIGTAGDPDKYGSHGSDSLAQNQKIDTIPDWAVLGAAEQMVLTAAATGGTADGDTAFSAGSVRVRIVYLALNSLDDA